MTLAWVEAQIEEMLGSANTAKNVYDLAMLCICRDELQRRTVSQKEQNRMAVVQMTAQSADLDSVPTIEQIEDAIGAVAANTPEERQRVKDLRTWAKILKGGG